MNGQYKIIRIRQGKETQLVRHHPWMFSGAVEHEKSPEEIGVGIVQIHDSQDRFIAYGWHDPKSHILVRLLSWDAQVVPDETWWIDMIRSAVRRRLPLFSDARQTNAFRLIHGEADFLPGIVADLYGSTIVCIISARVGWDHRQVVVTTLRKLLNPSRIIVSTDSSFCGIEQMKETTEWHEGESVTVPATVESIRFRELGLLYGMDPMEGQKSGFFCDQRDNRARVGTYASGRTCLDAFSYSGAFSLNLLASGARSVTAVDSSAAALRQLEANLEANGKNRRIPSDAASRLTVRQADVFSFLREMETDHYDLIILDPPKLAQTKGQVEGALRAYKDLNRLAIGKIRRGGIVATFSCSSGVSREQFRTMIAWAAKDAAREVQILETLGQGPDHPVRLSFPESEYLKGFILAVL